MKIQFLSASLVFYFLFIFQFPDHKPEQLYKCTCEEMPSMVDSSRVIQKVKYIYLVRAANTPDCCQSALAAKYPGFKETWENEAPNHRAVWGRTSLVKIKAKKAKSLGCAMTNKGIEIADLEKFPTEGREYYPEIRKQGN